MTELPPVQHVKGVSSLRLCQFLVDHIEPILAEWEAFARSLPPAETLSTRALRDHAKQMLLVIARDMRTSQTEAERESKGKGHAVPEPLVKESAAEEHGAERQMLGFDLNEMVSEYRALRSAVLRLWTLEDASRNPSAMDEIARFNEGIDQALAESVAAFSHKMAESRDTLMAVMGHELRSPLAALKNCLHWLRHQEPNPQRDQAFQIGTRSIASMERLICDLIEYTRMRLGNGTVLVAQRGDLDRVCRESFAAAKMAHPAHYFVYQGAGETNAAFDSARMNQVLTNLLDNAAQHGDLHSPITMAVRSASGWVAITVTNQGDAIQEEELQTIFEPLVQGSQSARSVEAKRSTSMGLGLFIARQIVTAHGGTIEVTSSLEAGTAFTVRIPVAAHHPGEVFQVVEGM